MRKIIVLALAALIVGAFATSDIFASGTPQAKSCGGTIATTKAVSADAAALAKECAKLCKKDDKCEFTTISVKGMTCGGCEKSLTATLSKFDGVLKVINVSHKDGVAEICYDPDKTSGDALAQIISNKGYRAEVVPAVATDDQIKHNCKATCKTTCTATCASICGKTAKTNTKCTGKGPN